MNKFYFDFNGQIFNEKFNKKNIEFYKRIFNDFSIKFDNLIFSNVDQFLQLFDIDKKLKK